MDIDDTPEEAAFRAEARGWLEAHAIPRGHPDDFSLGLWTGAYDEATYIDRCRAWQRTLLRRRLGRHHLAQGATAAGDASRSSR